MSSNKGPRYQVFEKVLNAGKKRSPDIIHNFTSKVEAKKKEADLKRVGTFGGFWDCYNNALSRALGF